MASGRIDAGEFGDAAGSERRLGTEDGRVSLSVREPHVALPALLSELASAGLSADQPDHAPREPGRRVRETCRPALCDDERCGSDTK